MIESKEDYYGDCYIHFEVTNSDGDLAIKQESERRTCQTHGVKNQIDFGKDWEKWEGWVQSLSLSSNSVN